MTHLRKMMLDELQRRNYAHTTAEAYIRALRNFAAYYHVPPDRLGPEANTRISALFDCRRGSCRPRRSSSTWPQ